MCVTHNLVATSRVLLHLHLIFISFSSYRTYRQHHTFVMPPAAGRRSPSLADARPDCDADSANIRYHHHPSSLPSRESQFTFISIRLK